MYFVITFPIPKAEEISSTLSGWHVKDYGSVYRWVLLGKEPLSLSWPALNIQMTKDNVTDLQSLHRIRTHGSYLHNFRMYSLFEQGSTFIVQ